MAENEPNPEPSSRVGQNDKARIAELEKVVKMLLKGFKDVENELGEAYLPEGTYYGIEFKD